MWKFFSVSYAHLFDSFHHRRQKANLNKYWFFIICLVSSLYYMTFLFFCVPILMPPPVNYLSASRSITCPSFAFFIDLLFPIISCLSSFSSFQVGLNCVFLVYSLRCLLLHFIFLTNGLFQVYLYTLFLHHWDVFELFWAYFIFEDINSPLIKHPRLFIRNFFSYFEQQRLWVFTKPITCFFFMIFAELVKIFYFCWFSLLFFCTRSDLDEWAPTFFLSFFIHLQ